MAPTQICGCSFLVVLSWPIQAYLQPSLRGKLRCKTGRLFGFWRLKMMMKSWPAILSIHNWSGFDSCHFTWSPLLPSLRPVSLDRTLGSSQKCSICSLTTRRFVHMLASFPNLFGLSPSLPNNDVMMPMFLYCVLTTHRADSRTRAIALTHWRRTWRLPTQRRTRPPSR